MIGGVPADAPRDGATLVGVFTLYAFLLGAAGGLLARYIRLPDPTP